MGCGKKKLNASVAVPPAPVRVPSQRPLAPSVTSGTSVANDKGNNEIIPGQCTDFLALPLAEENRLMKGLCDQSLPQMGSLISK